MPPDRGNEKRIAGRLSSYWQHFTLEWVRNLNARSWWKHRNEMKEGGKRLTEVAARREGEDIENNEKGK